MVRSYSFSDKKDIFLYTYFFLHKWQKKLIFSTTKLQQNWQKSFGNAYIYLLHTCLLNDYIIEWNKRISFFDTFVCTSTHFNHIQILYYWHWQGNEWTWPICPPGCIGFWSFPFATFIDPFEHKCPFSWCGWLEYTPHTLRLSCT